MNNGIRASPARLAAEWRELAVAAQWAVLHGPDPDPDPDPDAHLDPRAVQHQVFRSFGGDGTPEVEEYAAAELGLLMGVGVYGAAAILIRDAQDLQHRHPCLWAALAAGRGRVWKARKVVTLTHVAGLTRDQARFVDQATTRIWTPCRGRTSCGWWRPGSSRPTRTPRRPVGQRPRWTGS